MRIWAILPILGFVAAGTPLLAQSASPPAPDTPAESVTVTATPLPGRDAVDEFIYAYPTQVRTTEKIARWRIGICPTVQGIAPRFATFITTRLKVIAKNAGAPVNDDPKCRSNIEILFTNTPQAVGDLLRKDKWAYLGYFDNFGQADRLAKVSHDIQAWYVTATAGDRGFMRVDNPRGDFLSGMNDGRVFFAGNGGRLDNGVTSSLYNVIIVADLTKLGDYGVGSLADYIAMLALSQPKSFDACWEVPSITNLLTKDCDRKTATISDNDTRFLYGLYKMNAGYSVFQQRSEIRYYMEHRAAAKR